MTATYGQKVQRRTQMFADMKSAEMRHAARVRRINFRVYLAIWMAAFAYAFFMVISAPSLSIAIDRYIPLQAVAGIAAFAVFWSGRSLRRRTRMRRLRFVPAAFTAAGLVASIGMAMLLALPSDIRLDPARTTQSENARPTVLISL